MKIEKNRPLFIWTGIVIIGIIFLLLPVKIPYTIKTPGKILPVREWMLIRGTDGRLISLLKNNESGTTENYSVSQFERGDAIRFKLRENIASGSYISASDTIASIYSNEIERQYVQLKGDLKVAAASLEMNMSGEKVSLINEERKQLEYRKKQAEVFKNQFNRVESLYKKNLASQEEYEIAKSNDDLNEINSAISEARLQSLLTGSKPEQIEYIKAQISSLKNQIDILQKRFQNYSFIPGINGIVNQVHGGDTILTVSDTSGYVIISPVRWEEKNYIAPDEEMEVRIPDSRFSFKAELIRSENTVSLLNKKQVFLITSLIKNKTPELTQGLIVKCSVACRPVSPAEYAARIFGSIF